MKKQCSICGTPLSPRGGKAVCKRCRKKHICTVCGAPLSPSNASGLCRRCYKEKYRKDNKEAILARARGYYKDNREAIAVYNCANKEAISARHKAYYEANKDKLDVQKKAWREANPEKVREWRHERRAYLCDYSDCKKLNPIFSGCDFHHLTPDTGVHIPASLHRSVWHSLKTGQGMEKMNHIAFEWLHGVRMDSPQTTLEAFI